MGLYKGYPLKDVKKTNRVEIRLTDEELHVLERCSKELNTTKSEVLTIGLNLVVTMIQDTKK